MKKTSLAFLIFLVAIVISGCASSRTSETEGNTIPPTTSKKPPTPDIVIRIASADFSHLQKRIEETDIAQFASIVKQDSIDILSVQGITRYPNVSTRVDFVDRFVAHTSMRHAFGETANVSGRQGGNAVFSVYPIRSSENTHYDGLRSTGFEAALQAIVDCGARDMVIVSTQLPDRASPVDQSTVANKLATFSTFYINHPIVVCGNLPKTDALRTIGSFDEVRKLRLESSLPQVWYSNNGSVTLMGTRIHQSVFGPLVITQFGVFRQSQP